jgi:hypothetical protein
VLVDDVAAAGAAAVLDDDELDPQPPITAAIMATATTPAPVRARLDQNMGLTPPLETPACRSALNLSPAAKAKRFDQLAASPRG